MTGRESIALNESSLFAGALTTLSFSFFSGVLAVGVTTTGAGLDFGRSGCKGSMSRTTMRHRAASSSLKTRFATEIPYPLHSECTVDTKSATRVTVSMPIEQWERNLFLPLPCSIIILHDSHNKKVWE